MTTVQGWLLGPCAQECACVCVCVGSQDMHHCGDSVSEGRWQAEGRERQPERARHERERGENEREGE